MLKKPMKLERLKERPRALPTKAKQTKDKEIDRLFYFDR